MPKLTGKREHRTFVTLWSCAKEALQHAEASEDGSFYSSLSTNLAALFALEAFLNHLGPDLFEDWNENEERLSLKDKLCRTRRSLQVAHDSRSDEWQLLVRVINSRNYWVHGRTITDEDTWRSEKRGARPNDALRSDAERLCTPENARTTLETISQIMRELWCATGKTGNPFSLKSRAQASESGRGPA